jgi:hypothetical protein
MSAQRFNALQKEFKGPDDVPSEDIEAVAALLKESQIVEISEDGFQIRRKDVCIPPLLRCARSNLLRRRTYCCILNTRHRSSCKPCQDTIEQNICRCHQTGRL